jgi:hypothetical protein
VRLPAQLCQSPADTTPLLWIAHRIGAEIRLDFMDETQQTGLKVSVIVPTKQ